MRRQDETPLYATLHYGVRKLLDVSIAEYYYLDMVYHLSHNDKGYCYKSLESIADDMGVSKMGVVKMRNRLIGRGLIKKNIKGYTKTTEMYNSVIRNGERTVNLVSKPYNKVIPSGKLSYTKNNNRITLEKESGLKEKLQASNPILYKKLYK
jgi:Mn-dependent DtxR family transcriptional regulator